MSYKYNIVQLSSGHYAVTRTTPFTGRVLYVAFSLSGDYYAQDEPGFWDYCVSRNLETAERVYNKVNATVTKVIK